MGISLSDLSPKYQKQAVEKLGKQLKEKAETAAVTAARSKYGNQKTERAGHHFDSKKEARRFDLLMAEQETGQIKKLRLQVDFTLQEAYTTPEGLRIRAIRYRADFTYYRKTDTGWEYVVEDVKSKATKTKEYLMKKKLMDEKFGISIREV